MSADDSNYTVTHELIPGDRRVEGWVVRFAGKLISWSDDRDGAVLAAERHAGHRLPSLHDHAMQKHTEWLAEDGDYLPQATTGEEPSS
jgi:hypothetical protein